VPTHCIEEVVVLSLLRAPPSWLDGHGEEGVTIKVISLDSPLMVLKDDLHEIPEGGIEHVGGQNHLGVVLWGLILDDIILEYLVGSSKVLCQLEWSLRVHMGDAIEAKAKLTVDI